jgi:hypothetical protein
MNFMLGRIVSSSRAGEKNNVGRRIPDLRLHDSMRCADLYGERASFHDVFPLRKVTSSLDGKKIVPA